MISNLHRVMHGVAIKKHAAAKDIAALTGLDAETAGAALAAAEAGGRVVAADGKYLLSPAGQMILLGEYSRFCDALRHSEAFINSYERFELINDELKSLITDWQTMDIAGNKVANDHSDPDYDDRVIGRLGDLHERFEPVLETMIGVEARLRCYAEKLAGALEKAEDGAVEWVSDATIESYHTVWFEMHEDLLRMLGRERAE